MVFMRVLFAPTNNISPCNLIQLAIIFSIFLIGTFLPLIAVLILSYRNFRGITGDCIGALNDITRLSILILILIFKSLNLL